MSEHMKSDPKKVVHLNVERNSAANSQVALARLPAAMHALRDKARQQLQLFLRELFDKVDDAMFELADKANNNHDQNIFFDSMREVRIRRRAMETSFFRSIDISFAQLLDPSAYRDEKPSGEKSVSLDDLSLVKNDELEEMVAVDGMVNKANEQFAEPIQHLTLRIDHLVPTKVYQKNNPLGVDVICNAFTDATKALNVDVKAKLVLFKLFDNIVMTKLGKLFEVLNQTLIDANILPSLKQDVRVKKPSTSPTADHYGQGISAQYGLGVQKAGGETGGLVQSYDDQTNQVLHQLRDLLGANRSAPRVQLPGEEITTQDLIKILSLAQQQNTVNAPVTSGAPASLRNLLSDLLRNETHTAAAINQVDDDVINLVSMMFEFILDDRNLAAPMKALIGRLQIPMVKVAIADKTFFSKGGHPARRLLNEMAMACLGWQESSEENQRKDSLFNKMEETVRSILTDFDTDMSIFERLLVDFRSFLDKEKRRAQILEQRTIDAEDGKAKSERARAQVDAELNRICAGKELPLAVTKLLREAWANVMFITSLKQGVESDEWRNCSATAQQLVWSVTAAMDKDNRQRLLKLVPELLQKLRTGLESISFSPFETTNLFKQLESVHLARLRGDVKPQVEAAPSVSAADLAAKASEMATKNANMKAAMVEAQMRAQQAANAAAQANKVQNAAPAPVIENAAEVVESAHEPIAETADVKLADQAIIEPVADTVAEVVAVAEVATAAEAEQQFVVEETISESVQADPQHLALVNNITQGTWFEMQGDAGEKYRCRLAAIIRSVGKYIFVNRSGMKVAEESRESLAVALQTKRLTILDDGMLFDRALEAVIGTLREQRTLS
ncbi:DUF1631 domain-containing protein [Cellvibrio fibrivorans]|uniref:Thymidine phosphorylase n=1 Tax=Cellvibrio fibrivorans TaxID=126350 RepID=A0ABU1V2M5_9GAMM|nr:DUF1631 domain-containing protein [Cellvibrio fibrivorans]MDR7091701.1 hypothetical protein [Cellvibrio fibrivorans]